MGTSVEQAHLDIRAFRVSEWKKRWREKYRANHRLHWNGITPNPPEPTDADINWPDPTVSVAWGSGYIVMTQSAYVKLSAKQKTLFQKLGGL